MIIKIIQSCLQSLNAPSPIVVRLDGIVIISIDEYENAFAPIIRRSELGENLIDLIFDDCKALSKMLVITYSFD